MCPWQPLDKKYHRISTYLFLAASLLLLNSNMRAEGLFNTFKKQSKKIIYSTLGCLGLGALMWYKPQIVSKITENIQTAFQHNPQAALATCAIGSATITSQLWYLFDAKHKFKLLSEQKASLQDCEKDLSCEKTMIKATEKILNAAPSHFQENEKNKFYEYITKVSKTVNSEIPDDIYQERHTFIADCFSSKKNKISMPIVVQCKSTESTTIKQGSKKIIYSTLGCLGLGALMWYKPEIVSKITENIQTAFEHNPQAALVNCAIGSATITSGLWYLLLAKHKEELQRIHFALPESQKNLTHECNKRFAMHDILKKTAAQFENQKARKKTGQYFEQVNVENLCNNKKNQWIYNGAQNDIAKYFLAKKPLPPDLTYYDHSDAWL